MRCPICKEKLVKENKTLKCINNHSFDCAKQGYVNLSRKQTKNHGDNALMVKARTEFLEKNYYDFMRRFVESKLSGNIYVDAGCGQGYYTNVFGKHFTESYGIDLSKDAILHASKVDKHTQYIVGSLFDMPFEDESMDCVTSVFVPLGQDEIKRILKPNGTWIVVGPGPKHVWQLKKVLYETPYENKLPEFVDGYEVVSRDIISNEEIVEDVWSLLEMTPYRYKTSLEALEKVKQMERLEVTFEFVVTVYRKVNENNN
jgi:23S rRNA (guanine745-N1)-methyltransferase